MSDVRCSAYHSEHHKWRNEQINNMNSKEIEFMFKDQGIPYDDSCPLEILKPKLISYFHTRESYFRFAFRRLDAHKQLLRAKELVHLVSTLSDLKEKDEIIDLMNYRVIQLEGYFE